jgi:membrane-associated phospholipid phosphatase
MLVSQRNRIISFVLLALAGLAAAHALDGFAFTQLRIPDIYEEDLGRMFRVMGFVPLWVFAGAALMLHQQVPRRGAWRTPGALIIWGAALGGAVAELLKLVFRRHRPGEFGEYVFRPFTERTFSTGGLGLPSSHALVAFGAAAILSRLYPRARVIWWALAWGCGFTRIAAGAHFLSDVVAAAIIGWLVGAVVWRWRPDAAAPVTTPGAAAIRGRA